MGSSLIARSFHVFLRLHCVQMPQGMEKVHEKKIEKKKGEQGTHL